MQLHTQWSRQEDERDVDWREMDRRDRELLDKQLRRFDPTPRSPGTMILALVAVFLAGVTLGGFMFAYKAEPTRIASNAVTSTTLAPASALPIAR
jgi:hypothetical protein